MKKLMAGIDLHSNNIVVGLMDEGGKRVAHQKLDCELPKIRKRDAFSARRVEATKRHKRTQKGKTDFWPAERKAE